MPNGTCFVCFLQIRNSSDSMPQTAFSEGYSLLRSSCLWLIGVQPINGNKKTSLSK